MPSANLSWYGLEDASAAADFATGMQGQDAAMCLTLTPTRRGQLAAAVQQRKPLHHLEAMDHEESKQKINSLMSQQQKREQQN